MLFAILVIVALFTHSNAIYNELEWSSCSTASQSPAIEIHSLSVHPMVT